MRKEEREKTHMQGEMLIVLCGLLATLCQNYLISVSYDFSTYKCK
jgi:hypothetical protein